MTTAFTRLSEAISKLPDDELLERLRQTCLDSKRLLAELILLLIEVERRRLHLKKAAPSPFEFCVRRLGMSEGEAYRRTNAARLVARFPQLLAYIERGDVHLSALVQLRDYLTADNVDELVAMARGKNKMQVAEIVARLAPRPDVPARLRKLPRHDARSHLTKACRPALDPLTESRYRLQMTGSREFRDKLLRARDLMMHTNPSGDLGVVVERAVDELLRVLEQRIFGKLSRKQAQAPSTAVDDKAAKAPPLAPKRIASSGASKSKHPGLARTSTNGRVPIKDPSKLGAPRARGARPRVHAAAGRLAPAQVTSQKERPIGSTRRSSSHH